MQTRQAANFLLTVIEKLNNAQSLYI